MRLEMTLVEIERAVLPVGGRKKTGESEGGLECCWNGG